MSAMRDECEGGRSDNTGVSMASGSIDFPGIYDSVELEDNMLQATLAENRGSQETEASDPSNILHYSYNWPFVSTSENHNEGRRSKAKKQQSQLMSHPTPSPSSRPALQLHQPLPFNILSAINDPPNSFNLLLITSCHLHHSAL